MLGFNIGWPVCDIMPCNDTEAINYYERFFKEINAHGGNYARIWLGPNVINSFNALSLLKSYNEISENATYIIDNIILLAEKYEIRLMISLGSFNELCPDILSKDCHYSKSIWNIKNGGVLADGYGFLLFWSDEKVFDFWCKYIKFVI